MSTNPDCNQSTAHRLLVVGAGGHAKVVVDAVRCAGAADRIAPVILLVDDNPAIQGLQVLGIEVSAVVPRDASYLSFHVAIGDNAVRERKFAELAENLAAATVVHPRASVCDSAALGAGNLVAAQAVIGPDASLGEGCIVNHGAVVDHDCLVGAFCHIAPNATLAGNVRLGKRVLVGAGATILPGVSIGDNCVVGAGAVVLHDLIADSIHAGVPARIIDKGIK